MCGIAGIIDLHGRPVPDLRRRLQVMADLVAHRGPDDEGLWAHPHGHVGLAHRRLTIVDLSDAGHQPMEDEAHRVLTFNGEIYNYPELRRELGEDRFRSSSDTEVLLRAMGRWGDDALHRLRGMYAFALWDEPTGELRIVRDRFGIKPLYHAEIGGVLYFASEAKALMPFLPAIETDVEGLKDYLAFQFCLDGKTLFRGVRELLPGHELRVARGTARTRRYWEVFYDLDWDHTSKWFEDEIGRLVDESIALHLRADVPIASYLSGGLDSSTVASVAQGLVDDPMAAFTGKFSEDARYDESPYARIVADERGLDLREVDIGAEDFLAHVEDVIYHLDQPAAGPGSFPQYMVSRAAAREVKVILGGQGGDEIFGGYTRYLVAYFEQCIKAAIDGTAKEGNFVVTYESIIPNLRSLEQYKPMLQELWREGLFGPLDERYFRLVNRAPTLAGEVRTELLGDYHPFETFQGIFNASNVGHEALFDKMTHFDFKTLLPALLQVEDRVSMAHGLESRVPLLDHRLVELAATIPADVKFKDGEMKRVFKRAVRKKVPKPVRKRKDKMGFPVPLQEWLGGPARDWVHDVFGSDAARSRALFDNDRVLRGLAAEPRFGRKVWGLLCLELWQRRFHDRQHEFQQLMTTERTTTT